MTYGDGVEIERLRAENARLRALLKEVRDCADRGGDKFDIMRIVDEQSTRQKPENLGYCPIDGKQCDCIMPCSLDGQRGD